MSDAYWRYGDSRQPPAGSSLGVKRPRAEYDVSGGRDPSAYYAREDNRVAAQGLRDTETINNSYDRYLRSAQMPSHGGAESGRILSGGLSSHIIDDPRMGSDPRVLTDHRFMSDPRIGSDPRLGSDHRVGSDPRLSSMDPVLAMKGRTASHGSVRPDVPLPPDASSTLFVEGLPPNCSRREVAHIFRPFVGYKEVRLVTKEPKHPGGAPLILCFVDFASPAHAATAMDALQGYTFDENDRDSSLLRLQFARYPGARSGGGYRGKR